ncbi:hypothetical protein MIZ01_1794 [Sideroxyarcus emersonii]|uniref:Uncharacterized protein n=1 Tax=Sideroxyarcus emersonii TaxID=2764705 RepID=A0AAN2BZE4_9PROT|nr:hypothetical protein MIZ01_1794 [Sideroxyarcus emersonii]
MEAARIIALTAVIGFVDGNSRIEDAIAFRSSSALVTTREHRASSVAAKDGEAAATAGSTAYLVEVSRGSDTRIVLVDSATGRVLPS